MAVVAGAGSVAHGVHYTVLGVGVLGLVAMLAPGTAPVRRRTAVRVDDHDRRVAALRHALVAAPSAPPAAAVVVPPKPRPRQLWLPLAVVCTAAAAAVHAAVGPSHFQERALLGAFFAVASLSQLGWAVAVVARGSRTLLRLGAAGNATLALLWLATRTAGIPGLLPRPEAVGVWDRACVAWEIGAVVACVQALAAGTSYRPGSWEGWDPRARLLAALSAVGLVLLSISGAGS